MTITARTINDYNTIDIDVDGIKVATSVVYRRQRGFFRCGTEHSVEAPDFTPRKVRANPQMVVDYLSRVGLVFTAAKVVVC